MTILSHYRDFAPLYQLMYILLLSHANGIQLSASSERAALYCTASQL